MKYRHTSLKTKLENLSIASKIMFILVCIVIIRAGSLIPLPFVNTEYMHILLGDNGLGFLNSVTGGSFYQMSIFALSISPYITASIIVQLMSIVFPQLEKMRKEGKSGQDKYKKITTVTGIGLAFLQSAGMAIGLGYNGLIEPFNALTVIGAIIIWTAGAAALIGIGELISKLNVGNGISIILTANILSTLPSDVYTIKAVLMDGRDAAGLTVNIGLTVAVFLCIIASCIVLTKTVKKIKVTQSRKLAGFADSTFPIPLNTCSVMPVIFASSILSIPLLISRFVPAMQTGIAGHIMNALNSSYWFLPSAPYYTAGILLYAALTTFFAYFYLSIGFNPLEIADNFKKSGTVIPGIRPGMPTADYIEKVSTRVALLGNTCMTALILFMHLICNVNGLGTLSIAGTSVLICVNVILEEKKLADSAKLVKSYSRRVSFIGGLSRVA